MRLVKTPVAAQHVQHVLERHLDQCTEDACSDCFACRDLELPADVAARCLSHPFKGSQSIRLVKTPAAAQHVLRDAPGPVYRGCCFRRKASLTLVCARTSSRELEPPADVLASCLNHPFNGSQSIRLVKTPVAAQHVLREAPGQVHRGCCLEERNLLHWSCRDLELPADVLANCLSHPFKGSQSMRLVKTPVAAQHVLREAPGQVYRGCCLEERHLPHWCVLGRLWVSRFGTSS